MNRIIFFISFIVFFSCKNENKIINKSNDVRKVPAKPYIVPEDSILPPQIIVLNTNNQKKIKLGNRILISSNSNKHFGVKPKRINAGKPKINFHGKYSSQLSEKKIIDKKIVEVGIPETVIAKDAYTKDQNPQNFSSYSKLQGLTHTNITYLFEDNFGHLWLGTGGGGVSKFDGNTFTHFTEKEGLTNNFITSILQDSHGNLWFGTENGGVSEYDGRNFTNYSINEGLPSNFISCMLQDRKGCLWFGTKESGLSKYDGKVFIDYTSKQGLISNNITSILEDESGNIWVGTKDSGISVYDGKCFRNYTTKEGLSSNLITSIIQDKVGNIWIGTNGFGFSKFDGASFTHYTEAEGLVNNFVTCIIEDNLNNIWVGTNGGGVSKFDGTTFTAYTEKEGLNNNIIRHIIQDKNGTLWFGKGSGGVSKYNHESFTFFTEQEGLSKSVVLSIFEDLSGNMWFGTEGGGVSVYDGNYFTHYSKKEGLSENIVYSIAQDRKGNIWFGTSKGITKFDGTTFTQFIDIDGLSDNIIYSILLDANGDLWFGSEGGGVFKFDGIFFYRFTTKHGLSSNIVRTIYQDNSKNIWFGTYGGGITKFEFKNTDNRTINKIIQLTEQNGIPDNFIRSIIQDKLGNFWFGGLGFKGITFFNEKEFVSLTDKEGLSNNVVCSILEDKSGNIWCGNRFGLSLLSKQNVELIDKKIRNDISIKSETLFESFTYDDGFLGVGCNSNSIYNTKNGNLWIGANDRLTVYNPYLLNNNSDTIKPCLQLKSIELFNEDINWKNLIHKKDSLFILENGVVIKNIEFQETSKWYDLPQELSLSHDNNYLTFNFIGITTFRPKKVTYQFKLEGLEENWSKITNKTSATYGNLPAGDYSFIVRAYHNNKVFTEPYKFSFTIRPPWWKTWWFNILFISIILLFIIFYIKRREKKLKKANIKLEKTVRERTSKLIEKNNIVRQQKKIVEEKQKEILDSIHYAKRLQEAILPPLKFIDDHVPNNFVLYQPKDVVAGDFYWAESKDNKFFIAAADCTGHGVPGAMVSVVCSNALNRTVNEFGITDTGKILDKTRELVLETFAKGNAEVKDGMDISLLCIDKQNNKAFWSGANNPLWYVQLSGTNALEPGTDANSLGINVLGMGTEALKVPAATIVEIKADKQPIGKSDHAKPFTTHEITLQKGILFYLFTDGFADQFGGPKGKKFKYKQLEELLLANANQSMNEQHEILVSQFNLWKGDLEQIDDVCVIGVRV